MIAFDKHQFNATDNIPIHYYTTPKNADTKGILLIVHGMAEHAARYQEFADFLYRRGIIVYAIDQRGHGETGESNGIFGYFDETDGWKRVVEDVRELTFIAKDENPGLPLFILGHSMGSVVVRSALIDFGVLYSGSIIVGTTLGVNALIRKAGKMIALSEIKKYGPTHVSTTLEDMSFGGYNKNFNPARTKYDWLSENSENVDAYLSDPFCGFTCTSSFYYDLFSGLDFANAPKNIRDMPKALPVYLLSGAADPVGNMGKEVLTLYHRMKKAGLDNVQLTLYPEKRHELLNESNRYDVYHTILVFIQQNL